MCVSLKAHKGSSEVPHAYHFNSKFQAFIFHNRSIVSMGNINRLGQETSMIRSLCQSWSGNFIHYCRRKQHSDKPWCAFPWQRSHSVNSANRSFYLGMAFFLFNHVSFQYTHTCIWMCSHRIYIELRYVLNETAVSECSVLSKMLFTSICIYYTFMQVKVFYLYMVKKIKLGYSHPYHMKSGKSFNLLPLFLLTYCYYF